jgi:2-polyprenyl-6-methoxyphenol hydroxylase-like FAD-dependent oxidoreductase
MSHASRVFPFHRSAPTTADPVDRVGSRAVVMGASLAGLLSARVLADAFDEVVVVERDIFPEAPQPRRGVPQGRQVHALLARGREALDELLPDLSRDLVARGALLFDPGWDGRYHLDRDRTMAVRRSAIEGILLSRPLLEDEVRRRVLGLARVRALAGVAAEPVLERDRITGVRLVGDGRTGEFLPADLVLDATGRGSRTPAWLDRHALPRPSESTVDVGIGYSGFTFPRRPEDFNGAHLVLTFPGPQQPRLGLALAVEGGRWLVTAVGYCGDRPPTDPAGFRSFLDTTDAPEVAALARSREPLQPTAAAHRFPTSVRRHYERLSAMPDGLLVTGDAVASFTPVYAQGMTVAALEALELRAALAGGPTGLSRRFTTAVGRVVDQVWDLSAGSDLALPYVPGPRSLTNRVLNRYLSMVTDASAADADVAVRFTRVINMLDRPQALLAPGMVLGVLRGARATRATRIPTGDAARVHQPRPPGAAGSCAAGAAAGAGGHPRDPAAVTGREPSAGRNAGPLESCTNAAPAELRELPASDDPR